MWSDLVALFNGWYTSYVSSIKTILEVSNTDADGVTTVIAPEIWSAYVPWEELIAAAILIVFVVAIFKFVRSVICQIL